LRYTYRGIGYSNETHGVIKEAVYGKFKGQKMIVRANSNGFGGNNLFWSSTQYTWEITESSLQCPHPQLVASMLLYNLLYMNDAGMHDYNS